MVSLQETIRAFGHPNITSTHRSTVEVTKETHLNPEGDCIIGVGADKGARDLPEELKQLMKSANARVTLTIMAQDLNEKILGRGDPRLTFKHPLNMVFRRSTYTCNRTVMIQSSKAAADLDRVFVHTLRDKDTPIRLTIKAEL